MVQMYPDTMTMVHKIISRWTPIRGSKNAFTTAENQNCITIWALISININAKIYEFETHETLRLCLWATSLITISL